MRRLICFLIGHNYYIFQGFTYGISRKKCVRCSKDVEVNLNSNVSTEWDSRSERLQRALGFEIKE